MTKKRVKAGTEAKSGQKQPPAPAVQVPPKGKSGNNKAAGQAEAPVAAQHFPKTKSQLRDEAIEARGRTRNGRKRRPKKDEPPQEGGRREVFDADKAMRMIAAVQAGNYLNVARDFAGIHHATFANWVKYGNQGIQPYATFVASLTQAIATAEVNLASKVGSAANDGNWRAAGFLLERRFSKNWGRKDKIDLGAFNPKDMTDEELELILAAGNNQSCGE